MKRWIWVFDNHGEKQDDDAVEAMFDFLDVWKPHYRGHGGDLFDFTPIRRGASDSERHESMSEDIAEGLVFIRRYRPKWFLRGNHDERLWDKLRDSSGLMRDLAESSVRDIESLCEKVGCRLLPYDKTRGVLEFGDIRVVHGYYFGKYAANKHASTYGRCLFGHTHGFSIGTEPRWGGNDVAYNVPCLCKLDLHYNRDKGDSMRWEHGWSYGVLDEKTGKTEVWIARKVGDTWVYPSEMMFVRA